VTVLTGGVAVVTGGAGTGAGLGQGLVRRLVTEGMRVAILDMDEASAAALAQELRAEGADVLACAADVRDHDTVRMAAANVQHEFGACNVLCAHVGGGMPGRTEAILPEQWRETFETMVVGTVATVQAFLPLMRATTGLRRIVLTSSAAALAPGRFQGPYRAAKAAVTSIGETLDLELAPEGIGTTIAFPSGMANPSALAAQERGEDALSSLDVPSEWREVLAVLGEEMSRDPSDLTTGDAVAEPIVAAIAANRRYVVTHGVTVERTYRDRHELLEAAFAELAARRYHTTTS
jgi:NAD(P)-dependent dehydrogenase (short-subunit alcohol dehydrogenase family)